MKRFEPTAERKIRYYRGILRRIAEGWDTPRTLAEAALDHEFHSEECSATKTEWGECDCGAEEEDNDIER
jgi:hypothetical protein